VIILIEDITAVLVYGSIQGCIYALLALGFSLVYGVGGVLNQAHGALYLVTAYLYYTFYTIFHEISAELDFVGMMIGMIVGLIAVAFVAAFIYLALIKPLKQSHVGVVIVTFAFAFFMEQLINVIFGVEYQSVPFLIDGYFYIFSIPVYYHYVLIIIATVIIVILTMLFINRTKLGKSIRAVAQDEEAASLMGINVDRILTYTLVISGVLAGVAAILYVPIDVITPHAGWAILLNSFAIVVLGGLGSLSGSVVGAFIYAYAITFTNIFIDPILSAIIPFIVIIVMLIVRPRGIFGKKEIK